MSLRISFLKARNTTIANYKDLEGDDLLLYDAEMELMNMILLSIPNEIYNSVDACTSAKDMWKRVKRLMRGTIQNRVDRETRFTNEFDQFVAEPGEALVSVYNRFAQLMNDLERNNMNFPTVTINTKFLNNLQPEWLKYVTQVRLAKRLTVDSFDDLFDYLQQFGEWLIQSRAKKLENLMTSWLSVAHTDWKCSKTLATSSAILNCSMQQLLGEKGLYARITKAKGNVNSGSVDKDTHVPDLCAVENLARNAYQEAKNNEYLLNNVLDNSKNAKRNVAVYVRKNKQEDVIPNKENVIEVDVANASKITKSSETTFVAHKTRFSEKKTQSKTPDTTFVVSKSKIDVESASKAKDKVSRRDSNLYTISISDMAASSPVCLMSKATSTKSWLWHRRLSHLNFGTINDLTRLDLVDGLPKFKYGKRSPVGFAYEWEKSKKASHHVIGSKYTWVYFLRSKDETPEIIKKFIAQAQLNYKAKVCKIRTDNGTEFKNTTLKAHYEKLGIMQQFSIARTPQQNGVVERRNHTLVEAARTMLIFSRLPEFLWAEAVAIAFMIEDVLGKMKTKKQDWLHIDSEVCMYALTVSTIEPKNIKEAMADHSWIESMQDELNQFERTSSLGTRSTDQRKELLCSQMGLEE
ncbi:retrovirus-related pol polyprotein from transposon TNT 1-94 [Tanacetum coccineum]|uniref:Retrovirus-related pol polyprotein from transposon TNT 1-94 n=1 Tax=Tanacetum coccineum TaxID=301880 RepID=A0ABQ5F3J0_9ASTR